MVDVGKVDSLVRTINSDLFALIYQADLDVHPNFTKVVYHLNTGVEIYELIVTKERSIIDETLVLRSIPIKWQKASNFREIYEGKFTDDSWNEMTSVLYDNFTEHGLLV